MTPRILFVSKPIVPPFRDGTKCLVRDVALHVQSVQPIVMSTANAPPLEQAMLQPAVGSAPPPRVSVLMERAYATSGRYTPSVAENARAALWLLLHAQADVWHFVFAPNPRTSTVARWLRRIRRIPVLQTVASPPRSFARIDRLLFGDLIVAQSQWTARRIRAADGTAAPHVRRIEVIPPPVAPLVQPSPERIQAQRHELDVPRDAPVFVYPGDLEVSGGADEVRAAVEPVLRELPQAVFVFACRFKSARAPQIAQALLRCIGPQHARITPNPTDLLALLAGCTAVLFPVDDLWGKVDLPIVLLEAMSLGAPVVVWDNGPLRDLAGALLVPPADRGALVRAAVDLAHSPELGRQVVQAQLDAVRTRFSAAAVAAAYERLYFELARGSSSG
jgi:glycosyltransferase involved in cell wall biosynthesis